MRRPSVLLIGIGGYGEFYVRHLISMNQNLIELIGAVDPCADKSSCKKALDEQGIPIYQNSSLFWALDKSVDLVVIASPIHTHYTYAVEALEHGSNVLCEKPVVLDLQQLADLQKRQKESGLFVAVGYQQCFAPGTQALKSDIASGLFGKPKRMKALQFLRRGDSYYGRNNWAGKLHCGGQPIYDSPLSNACAHHMQTMLFLLGADAHSAAAVHSVEGKLFRARPDIETYDASAVKVTTGEGVEIWYYIGHCIAEKRVGPIGEYEFERATLFFEQGVVTAHLEDGTKRCYEVALGRQAMNKLTESIACSQGAGWPSCTVDSVTSHVEVVLKAQSLESDSSFQCEYSMIDGDGTYVSLGLLEAFEEAYKGWNHPVCENDRAYAQS